MRKATLKGLMAHKFRLAATALAIVLGVSFVSGTYVLTDTITASFDSLFKQVTQGIDVAVRSEETFGGFEGETRDPMPASLLERIKAVDGVRVAEGNVTGSPFLSTNWAKPLVTLPSAVLTPSTALTWSSRAAGIGSRTSLPWVANDSSERTATSMPWVTSSNRLVKVALMVSVST